MRGWSALRRMTIVCALASSMAASRAPAQAQVADLNEDVRELTQRVGELSRMLSGHPDSDAARAHARELLAST